MKRGKRKVKLQPCIADALFNRTPRSQSFREIVVPTGLSLRLGQLELGCCLEEVSYGRPLRDCIAGCNTTLNICNV